MHRSLVAMLSGIPWIGFELVCVDGGSHGTTLDIQHAVILPLLSMRA